MPVPNSFAQPRTPGQWLLGSLAWTALALAGWRLADHLLAAGRPAAEHAWLAGGCFGLAHLLVWWRAATGFGCVRDDCDPRTPALVLALAERWWRLLLWFQVLSLVLVPLWYWLSVPDTAGSSYGIHY